MSKKLKCEKKTYLRVSYKDFDSFVESVYGCPFSVTASEEMRNDSVYSFNGIDGIVDEYDEERIDSFLKGNEEMFIARILLNDLARKGHIEPGDYIINVCW